MLYIFLALIVGVNLAPFVFANVTDIWHAQGAWVQISILIAFSWSFFENKKERIVKNIPLGLLHLWVGVYTAYICYVFQFSGKYNNLVFFPYFNFLCLLIMYQIIVQFLGRNDIELIMKAMKYTLLYTLFLCVLQNFNLSQFFNLHPALSPKGEIIPYIKNNLVTGVLGNGTHLSGFLACGIPLLLWKFTREDKFILALLITILFFTGQEVGDPSITGFIVAFVVTAYMFRFKYMVFVIPFLFVIGKVIYDKFPLFFHFHGRFDIWNVYLEFFRKLPITGAGLGAVKYLSVKTIMPNAKHLHMEYFHFMFELGIIGLVLILNIIKSFFSFDNEDRTQFVLKAYVLGFLVSCCFNYPAHLWLPASWALFAYASVFALRNEERLTYA